MTLEPETHSAYTFALSPSPIDCREAVSGLRNAACGALVTFEGWVRNFNEGRPVVSLHYEAYPALAHAEAGRILAEAATRFQMKEARIIHRTGTLEVGDVAVWLGVVAVHRDTAFDACRYLIDELKVRVPIWKKENYADAGSEWVRCLGCAGKATRHSHPVFGATARTADAEE